MHIQRSFLVICALVYCAISLQTNWQLQYSQFHQWSITDCDGWIESNEQPVQVKQCNQNGMDIIYLDKLSNKQITLLPPHFEIQFYGDVYLLDSWDTETGFVMLDGITQFTVTLLFSSFPHFQNQCGAFWANYVKITTVNQIMQHISNSVQIIIGTNLDELFSNESFNFRNIQLWVRLCHKTCETCNGDSEGNCLTCFQGIPNLGVCSSCDNQNTQYFQNYTGCVQECERHTQADDSLNCIVNSKIQVSTDYNWQVMNEFGSITSRQITCNGLIIDGIFNSNEWMKKDILISPTTTKLRIRVTFYMFYPQQLEQFSQIEFSMNGQMINLVYNDFGQVKPIKSKVIYSISGTCIENLEDFQIIRTEQTIGVIQAASNVHFKIKAKQNWGVKDIYIDEISCSLNCDVCLDENNCASCQSGYYVHHKQCVSDCPLHSDKDDVNYQCIDFDEETEKTSYLLKAFYLESSPPQEATVYFDLISQTGFNFMKGVQFSYLRNKRIFGGAITWHNAVFSKAYTIIPPHMGFEQECKSFWVMTLQMDNLAIKSMEESSIQYIQQLHFQTSTKSGEMFLMSSFTKQINTLATQEATQQFKSSKCEIEANWMCDIVNHQSFCNFKVDPKFVLKYVDNQSETQYVTIGFTNAMKKQCDFNNIQLEGCEDNQYTFVTTPIAQAKFNTLLMVEQLVENHFNKNCIRPKFKIYLSDNKCLVNYYEQELNSPFDHVFLNQINIISKDNEQKVTNLELFSQYIFYKFLGLFALSLMTGSLDLMWNMLDLLQYSSYLQFINFPFPKNLDLYFEIFGTVSMHYLKKFKQKVFKNY